MQLVRGIFAGDCIVDGLPVPRERDGDAVGRVRVGPVGRVCLNVLGHGEGADALVGDDDGGLAGEQAREVAVAQIGLQVFVRVTVDNGRLLDAEPEPACFCAPGETFVFCVNRDIAERLDGMVFLEAFGVQLQLDGLCGCGLFQRGIPARLRLHAGGGDIGERAVNVVNGGKGGHGRDQMALRDRDGHAVVIRARVGHHAMLVIHKDGDSRGVDLVAHRRAVLNEVVFALGEHLALGRERRLAVCASGDGIIGGCALDDRPSGVGDEQIILLVEGEGHAVDRIVVVVELLHVEVVLDVGDIDGGGKLALKVRVVDPVGIVYGSPRNGFGRGVIIGNGVGGVDGIAAMVAKPEIVAADVAGAVVQFGHVGAVGGKLKDEAVVGVLFCGVEHGLKIAAAVGNAVDGPAAQRVASDDTPTVGIVRLGFSNAVQTVHDDSKERASAGKIGGAGHNPGRIAELDAGAGVNGLLGHGVGAGRPMVILVIEQKNISAMLGQLEINVAFAAIALARAGLAQDEIIDSLIFQLVEADGSAGFTLGEDKAAIAVGDAGSEQAALSLFLAALGFVDDITLAE